MFDKGAAILSKRWAEMLKAKKLPWQELWRAGVPINALTGEPYTGVNGLLLGMSPFSSPYWVSDSQLQAVNGKLRRDSRPFITLYRYSERESIPRHNPADPPLLRFTPKVGTIPTFNIENVEGIRSPGNPPGRRGPSDPLALCEKIVRYMPRRPAILHVRECMRPRFEKDADRIVIPLPETYPRRELFFYGLFHELIHSTGTPERLDRETSASVYLFGEDDFTLEGLIAQIGAAALSWIGGILYATKVSPGGNARKWLETIKTSPAMPVHATAYAAAAVERITGALGYHLAQESGRSCAARWKPAPQESVFLADVPRAQDCAESQGANTAR